MTRKEVKANLEILKTFTHVRWAQRSSEKNSVTLQSHLSKATGAVYSLSPSKVQSLLHNVADK